MRIFGAFTTARTLASESDTRDLAARASRSGISHLFVETRRPPTWLRAVCNDHSLQLVVSMPCFFEDDLPPQARAARIHPVSSSGARRPKLEWYTGAVPTDRDLVDALSSRLVTLMEQSDPDGVCLDFIRWPLHWELELRPQGPRLGEYSFDDITVSAFNAYAGLDLALGDPANAAAQILSAHRPDWERFRTDTVTAIAQELVRVVHGLNPNAWTGAFVVPMREEQRICAVGQSAAALAQHVDVLLPMAYHAIIEQPRSLAVGLVEDVKRHAPLTSVVPLIQTTADPSIADGADWGSPFDFRDLRDVMDQLRDSGEGFVLFPAEGLREEGWHEVSDVLGSHLQSTGSLSSAARST